MSNNNSKHLFIVFTSDFYKFYYSLNTANTLRACNKEVSVFITGYSCNFIFDNWISFDKKNKSKAIKENKMASYEEVLDMSKDLNINFYYCDTALDLLKTKSNRIIETLEIKPIGLYHIINKFKEDHIIFI